MRKIGYILCLVAFFSTQDALAQCVTYKSGTIVDETWTLSGSPYCVTGDLQVSLLTIEEGVEVLVDGHYQINVLTTITAIGSEGMPIRFSSLYPDEPDNQRWKGIKFQNTIPGTVFRHCIIEYSDDSGVTIIDSTPTFEDCVIRNNTSSGNGGGISASLAAGLTLTLDRCTISGNISNPLSSTGNYAGGGLYVLGDAELSNCLIENNEVNAQCTSASCNTYARGGGVYVNGRLQILNSEVKNNLTWARSAGPNPLNGNSFSLGAGIYLQDGNSDLTNTIISCNTTTAICNGSYCGVAFDAYPRGAGVYVNAGTPLIENTTIVNNSTQGLWHASGDSTVINSILFFNNDDGEQIRVSGGTISVSYSDVQNEYEGTGNINNHPAFLGTTCDDLIIIAGSPCIDAGDPSTQYNDACLPPSLGTTRNDMGAHGGPSACGWSGASSCVDSDGDGYGDPADPECTHPELDCNDGNPNIFPTNPNNNCDCAEPIPEGTTEGPEGDPTCGDGIDNDCDGSTDGDDSGCTTTSCSAASSTVGASPFYGGSDLAKHLLYILLPLGAIIAARVSRRKK